MRVLLAKEVIFASGLSHSSAIALLKQAADHPCAEYYGPFSIVRGPNETDWSLRAFPRNVQADFLVDPDKFVLELAS